MDAHIYSFIQELSITVKLISLSKSDNIISLFHYCNLKCIPVYNTCTLYSIK